MSDLNPSTGDWYIGRIDLASDGSLFADVYGTQDYSPKGGDLDLSPLFGIMDNAVDAIPLDNDADLSDNHWRGPYDLNQLNRFFLESGLRDVVTVHQDTETGDYYVYINTEPSTPRH